MGAGVRIDGNTGGRGGPSPLAAWRHPGTGERLLLYPGGRLVRFPVAGHAGTPLKGTFVRESAKRKARKLGFVPRPKGSGSAMPVSRPVGAPKWFVGDYPDRVEVATVPRVAYANEVFDPDEFEGHMAYYARRAEARLPLFADGRPDGGVRFVDPDAKPRVRRRASA